MKTILGFKEGDRFTIDTFPSKEIRVLKYNEEKQLWVLYTEKGNLTGQFNEYDKRVGDTVIHGPVLYTLIKNNNESEKRKMSINNTLCGFKNGAKFTNCDGEVRTLDYNGYGLWAIVCDDGTLGCSYRKSSDYSIKDDKLCVMGCVYTPVSKPVKTKRAKVKEKFYKVVSRSIKSLIQGNVEYKLNEFVYPTMNGTYLFVFDNLSSAESFALYRQGLVYECEVESVLPKDSLPKHLESSKITDFPPNTRFAYGVKLTKCLTNTYGEAGKKWYFVNSIGNTEEWEEIGDGTAKRIDIKNMSDNQPVTADTLGAHKLRTVTAYWFLTHDRNEWQVMAKLIQENKIKLC